MRTSHSLLAVLAAVAAAGPTLGQRPIDDKPFVFFSPDPALAAVPERPDVGLPNLRPNADLVYYLYAYNPKDGPRKVTVELVTGRAGDPTAVAVAGTASLELGPRGKPTPVSLKLRANPASGDKPAGFTPLVGKTFVRATSDFEEPFEGEDWQIGSPANYTDAAAAMTDGKLKVTVSRKEGTLRGGPIPVRLSVRTPTGPVPVEATRAEGNTLQGMLAAVAGGDGGDVVELVFDAATVPTGVADVAVDGVERVFRFEFAARDRRAGRLTDDQGRRAIVDAPSGVITGKPLRVAVLTNPSDAGKRLDLILAATPSGSGQVKRFPTARDMGLSVRAGEAGELAIQTRSTDWTIELPTAGVYGKRWVRAEVEGGGASDPAPVVFDDTPPAIGPVNAEPANPRTRLFAPGQRMTVTASATDDESEIVGAPLFILGEPPAADGKLPPNSDAKLGVLRPATAATAGRDIYEATFVIPLTTKLELPIGVRFTNGVGLTALKEVTLGLDATPPEISPIAVVGFPARPGPVQPGDRIAVTVQAADPDSGLDPTFTPLFYVGEPPLPDGTALPGSQVKAGIEIERPTATTMPGKLAPPTFYAKFQLPKDTGKLDSKVGVVFRNNVGLVGVKEKALTIDPGPPPLTGKIKAKVVRGGSSELPQVGVPVRLVSPLGVLVATGVTDECGVAVFPDLPPGAYFVWGVQPKDANAQGTVLVPVVAGKTTETVIPVLR